MRASGTTRRDESRATPTNSASTPTPSRMNRVPVSTPSASSAYESASTAITTVTAAMYGAKRASAERGSCRPLPDGRDRRHPRRAQGRREPGDQRDQRPDEQRDDDRPGGEDRVRLGQVEVERHEQLVQTDREAEAREQPDHGREQADDERLDDHGAQHLAARRADRPQRRELARPLRDGDRQRVEDHERPDEQGDAREGEQEVADDRRERRDLVRVLGRLLGPRPHRDGVADLRPDPADELLGRDAGLRGGLHGVQLAPLVQQRLGGRDVEDGERRAAERAEIAVLARCRRSRTAGRARAPRRRSDRRERASPRRRPARRSRPPAHRGASALRRG